MLCVSSYRCASSGSWLNLSFSSIGIVSAGDEVCVSHNSVTLK